MSSNSKSDLICGWCFKITNEGTVHLPTEKKGVCAIVGGKIKRKSARHPVDFIASGKLYELERQIHKAIFDDLKIKYGNDMTASTLVVNWQMGVMNFCQILLKNTNMMILTGAHQAYMDEMEGKNND